MKQYIELNIQKDLNFDEIIAQIISLSQEYIIMIKNNIHNKSIQDDTFQAFLENEILTQILCDYFKTSGSTISPLGCDFNQVWENYFPKDLRNKLGNYILTYNK